MERRKKILSWTAGVCAALLAMLSAAVILLPRLVNTEQARSKIENVISRDLGGTFLYDRITLSVLPRPRIIVHQPKIEIPGKVSAALESVDIYPAILPLLRGKIRVKDVHLESPDATVTLPEGPPTGKAATKPPAAPGPTADAILSVAATNMPDIAIGLDRGRITVRRAGRQTLAVRDLRARVTFLSDPKETEPAKPAVESAFRITGSAGGTIDSPDVPLGPVSLAVSRFEALPGTFTLEGTSVHVGDLSLALSGRVDGYLSKRPAADISVGGTAGPIVVQWLRDSASLSPLLTPRSPLGLSDARIRWEPGTLQTTGRATVKDGPALTYDVRISSGNIFLKRLTVKDKESLATFSLNMSGRIADASFSGNLTARTLGSLFGHALFPSGWIKGDMKAHVPLDRLSAATAEGMLEAEQVVVPWKQAVPFTIDRLALSVRNQEARVDPAAVTLGRSKGVLSGGISVREGGLFLDVDLASQEIVWDDLGVLFHSKEEKEGREKQPGEEAGRKKKPFPVRGELRVNVESLRSKRFVFHPVHGTITLGQERTSYDVRETAVCSIGVTGTVVVSRGTSNVQLNASAKEQDLAPALTCLAGEDQKITGKFDLSGSIAGQGPNETLLRSLAGKIAFAARNGRVYNDIIVVPILKYKKTADLLGDKAEDAKKNGIPYDVFGLRGDLESGSFRVSEGVVKSRIMNLAASGSIDLVNDRLDITVLMAPFKTIDRVVKKIPLLVDILGGTLVTVPLRIQGPFKAPKVTPLPPSAIGEGLLGIMRRTLEVPFQVVDDITPGKRSAPTPSAP